MNQTTTIYRTVRIFISSTFSDMKKERELLAKNVLPQLQEKFHDKRIEIIFVDLRWGILDETAAEGNVLSVCLEEIDNCRPFFIGLLGDRYGWVPEKIHKNIIESEPWLEGYNDRSITELEMLHGALNDPANAKYAFFYFRDNNYSMYLDEYKVCDQPQQILSRAPSNNSKLDHNFEKSQLTTLKSRIKSSNIQLKENYASPEELTELVLQDLSLAINNAFPELEVNDPYLSQEKLQQNYHNNLLISFIENTDTFETINEYIKSEVRLPLIITGDPGSGKSSLLANWIEYASRKYSEYKIFRFYNRATEKGYELDLVLTKILNDLKRDYDTKLPIPNNYSEILSAFKEWLFATSHKRKCIIIIDGIDQIEQINEFFDFSWLPEKLPDNVKLILSLRSGNVLKELEKHTNFKLTLKPIETAQQLELVKDYLSFYSKKIDKDSISKILGHKLSGNPQFLRILLDELITCSDYENFSEILTMYLQSEDLVELYKKIISRFEKDYGIDSCDIVKDTLCFLYCSRKGMLESELIKILNNENIKIPQFFWSPFFIVLRKVLINQDGIFSFSNDSFSEAVYEKYLMNENVSKLYYSQLSTYFLRDKYDWRSIEELPWTFINSQNWNGLHDLITDLKFIKETIDIDRWLLHKCWSSLEEYSEFRMNETYTSIINNPSEHDPELIGIFETLFMEMAYPQESLILSTYLAEYYRNHDDFTNCLKVEIDRANVLYFMGKNEEALKVYGRCENIIESHGLSDNLYKIIIGQANVHFSTGKHDLALNLYNKAETLSDKYNDIYALQLIQGNIADIFMLQGRIRDARNLLKKKESVCRENGWIGGIMESLGLLAKIDSGEGNYNDSLEKLCEQEGICRMIGNKRLLVTNLDEKALIYYYKGKYTEAKKIYDEAFLICEKTEFPEGLMRILTGLANISNTNGDIEEAMSGYRSVIEIGIEHSLKEGTLAALGNLGTLHYKTARFDEAMEIFEMIETECKDFGDKDKLQKAIECQGLVQMNGFGKIVEAIDLFQHQENICRKYNYADGLQQSLGHQGEAYLKLGKIDFAMEKYKEMESICRKYQFLNALPEALFYQANIYHYHYGQLNEARNLYILHDEVCRQIGNLQVLAQSLPHQIQLCLSIGDYDTLNRLQTELEQLTTNK